MATEAVELFALLQCRLVMPAAEIDRQVAGNGAQLRGDVVVLLRQRVSLSERFNGFR